jgi:hypothetical protein
MKSGRFYRNIRARDELELFLVSAATSLLLVRLYLHITGYPQIGGSLHIAHMLWGGLLMLAALVIALSFMGSRAQRIVALVGGVGFGIFIDELGKFITHDNNYFYQPTVALIYAIFIVLYLTINFLGRTHTFTSREYQLNALSRLEEAILSDMDTEEKRHVEELLAKADDKDPITTTLKRTLEAFSTVAKPKPTRVQNIASKIRRFYLHHTDRRKTNELIRIIFLIEVTMFALGGILTLAYNISSAVSMTLDDFVSIGQFVSALVSVGFVFWGIVLWGRSHLGAYEQFRRATLVNLFLTQFFVFARLEFIALPGFIFSLALLGFITYHMHQLSLAAQSKLKG